MHFALAALNGESVETIKPQPIVSIQRDSCSLQFPKICDAVLMRYFRFLRLLGGVVPSQS